VIYKKEFDGLYTCPTPFMAVAAARGLGKTVAAVQWLTYRLLEGPPEKSVAFYSSTLKTAKLTVTPVMRMLEQQWPEGFCSFHGSDNKFVFKIGRNDIREMYLFGYEGSESKRGFHPHTIVLDECSLMPSGMYGTVILPTLKSIGNWQAKLLAIGTAQGKSKFYDLIKQGCSSEYPEWTSFIMRASQFAHLYESGFLKLMANNMTNAEYAQEFECDFNACVLVGSVYGEFIRKFVENNTSDEYNYDPSLPVYTAWDIGYNDNTSIWFFQVKGNELIFIDYLEGSGNVVQYYANEVLAKPYNFRKAILPPDAGHKRINAPISFAEDLRKFGVQNEVLSPSGLSEGINQTRMFLKTAKFNKTKCAKGLDHIRQYRYKFDYRLGVNKQDVVHDIHSHAADALRYAAVGEYIWKEKKIVNDGRIVSYGNYNPLQGYN